MSSVAETIGKIGSAIGRGLIAGAAGTAAITTSQMVEMKIEDRPPSSAPADAASKALDIQPATPEDKAKFSQEVHWTYGTLWGVTRGVLSLFGVKGWTATALHWAALTGTEMIMEPSLGVAKPVSQWSAKQIVLSSFHHAVYAVATGLVFDAIDED